MFWGTGLLLFHFCHPQPCTQAFIFFVATSAWAVWLPGWHWKVLWVPAWLAVAYFTYREMCAAAGRYCDSLEAIITVNRTLPRHENDKS